MTRKRKRHNVDPEFPFLHKKARHQLVGCSSEPVQHTILARYYHEVLTLREYILSRFSENASKARRRKLACHGKLAGKTLQSDEADVRGFSDFLDKTLVGVKDTLMISSPEARQAIEGEKVIFSQMLDSNGSTSTRNSEDTRNLQSEVCVASPASHAFADILVFVRL